MKLFALVLLVFGGLGGPAVASAPGDRDSDGATAVLGAAVRRDRPALPPPTSSAADSDRPLFIGLLVIVAVGTAKILFRRRLSSRHAVSLDAIMVAIGFVLLLLMRLPLGGTRGWVGALLFVGLVALYRLLGFFEEPPDRD